MNTPIIPVALTGVALLLPSAAVPEATTPIAECEYGLSYGPDNFYRDNRDLGAGFVMYAWHIPAQESGNVIVANCFSGSTLEIEYAGKDSEDQERFVLEAAASLEKVTLSNIREHFSSLGVWTGLSVQNVEHCACAAFYPDAKAAKVDWTARRAHP